MIKPNGTSRIIAWRMILLVLVLLLKALVSDKINAQEDIQYDNNIANLIEDYLESIEEQDFDYNTLLENLTYYYRHPIHVNHITEDILRELLILNELQIASFLSYRSRFGPFISIYELQAIPTWDLATVRMMSHFLKVDDNTLLNRPFNIAQEWADGRSTLFLKHKRVLEQRRGFIPDANNNTPYIGDPNHLYVRYRFENGQRFKLGFTMEKDPGEPFFKNVNKYGFDFYSFFIYASNINSRIEHIVLGDYAISFGQGLILHNDFGAGKSSFVMNVKKGGRKVRPYSSVNEVNFFRGGAMTYILNPKIKLTIFGSRQSINGTVRSDTIDNETVFNSFGAILQNGLHRTVSEISKKNQITQINTGLSLAYQYKSFQMAFNGMHTQFSQPLVRDNALYRQFLFSGESLTNMSIDYSYRYRNYTFFGEGAHSIHGGYAIINGVLATLDRKLDVSLVHRKYDPNYQVLNANAFSESTQPINENGVYLGLQSRLNNQWIVSAYVDFWHNPWASFRRDGPADGKEFFIKINYTQKRKLDAYIQYRFEQKQLNTSDESIIDFLKWTYLHRWRFNFSYKMTKEWEFRHRLEFSMFNNQKSSQWGQLAFQDIIYKPIASPFSFTARYAVFNIDDFNTRIYTFENDILYEFFIPFFQGQGSRFYVNMRYRPVKNWTFELRYGRTFLRNQDTIGSSFETIEGNTRSELKSQIRITF